MTPPTPLPVTMPIRLRTLGRLAVVLAAVVSLGACNALTRLSEVGQPPKMTKVENPVERHDYRPVTMPMPEPELAQPKANSLWRPGARAFFKDQRASEVGDILTVKVTINDNALLENSTERERGPSSESASVGALAGFERTIDRVLPTASDMGNLADFSSSSQYSGSGKVDRNETVELTLAAVVLQTLPNGNLVIAGRQEVRVNHELRELNLTGVIRPSDITSANTVESSKIAELRVSYGGRGMVSDVQQPRYGTQIFDIIFPF